MSQSYYDCANVYAHRRNKKKNDWKPVSHNQWLRYDPISDCYLHRHHRTTTVEIYRDKYVVNTGGWDTVTTWAKIHQYACIHLCGRPTPSFVASKFVYWDGFGGRAYTKFYDGIEVGLDGVPFEPKPVEMRRAKPGARAEFYATAKKVRAAVALRALVGEFDNVHHTELRDGAAWALMQSIAARSEGLFEEFIPYGEVAPLFAQRQVQAFGRPRNDQREEMASPQQRLASNINAAMRAWESTKPRNELYETYQRSYT